MNVIHDPVGSSLEDYLADVQSVAARVKLPKVLPSRIVQIIPAGGSARVVAQNPMVTFKCFAESSAKAFRLASEIQAHLEACRRLNGMPVYRVAVIGMPVERPEESERFVAQFTLQFLIRSRAFPEPTVPPPDPPPVLPETLPAP